MARDESRQEHRLEKGSNRNGSPCSLNPDALLTCFFTNVLALLTFFFTNVLALLTVFFAVLTIFFPVLFTAPTNFLNSQWPLGSPMFTGSFPA